MRAPAVAGQAMGSGKVEMIRDVGICPLGVPTSILLLVLYILVFQTLVCQKIVLFPCLYNLHTSW
jgi:hypothetical protein